MADEPEMKTSDATNGQPNMKAPDTQSSSRFAQFLPDWYQEFPHFLRFPPPKKDYQFIKEDELNTLLAGFSDESRKRLIDDLKFLDYELMRLFRERDREAAYNQNRYRAYQIWYILLATLAGAIGGMQALFLGKDNTWVSIFAFLETIVALIATYLATISSREPPLPIWLDNRRRAENMRREFYRYLLNLAPYDQLEGTQRKRELSRRAADINRGVYPDEVNS